MSVEFTNKWNHFGKMQEKSVKKEIIDDYILSDAEMNNDIDAVAATPGEDSGEYLMKHFAVFLKMRRNKKYGNVDDVPNDYKYERVMTDMSNYGMPFSVERSIRKIENEFGKSQKSYRLSRSMKSLAKVCALVLLVLGVSFNSIVPHAEAFRWKFYDVFFQDKGGNSDVIILGNGRLSDDEVDEETLRNEQAASEALMEEKEGQILYPTALPDRYKVKNINKQSDGFIVSLWLEGSGEDDLVLLDYNFNNKIRFNTDTEHTELHNILINNNDGIIIETKYRYKLVWVENGISRFMTFAKEFFEYEEAIRIAESIEWVDEVQFEL